MKHRKKTHTHTQSSGPRRLAFGRWGGGSPRSTNSQWRHGLEQGITDNRRPRGAPLAIAEQEYEWFFPQGTKCVKVSSGSIQKKCELRWCCCDVNTITAAAVCTYTTKPSCFTRRSCSWCFSFTIAVKRAGDVHAAAARRAVCVRITEATSTQQSYVVIGLSAVMPPLRQTAGSPSDVHAVFDEATGGAQLWARAHFSLMGAM